MILLETNYLGLQLKNPIVISPSPLCESLDNLRWMEEAGAAAVVLHSLFEEQISLERNKRDRFVRLGTENQSESLTFFPDMEKYNSGPEGYLEHVHQAKSVLKIPVIGSLSGVSLGSWLEYAKKIEAAGADALELNLYDIPVDPGISADELEKQYCELVHQVQTGLAIPLAIKLHPFFTALPNFARKLNLSGARGLVLFNRFYQPDFDLEQTGAPPQVVLSSSQELLLRLHWVAILYGNIGADLAITGGIHSATDALKAMMAGAKIAMMTSAILKHGIRFITTVLEDLQTWMVNNDYESIRMMQGSMSRIISDEPAAFERANYMKVLRSNLKE